MIVLHLHKFKKVAFYSYNVYLNFVLDPLLFLDFYPKLALIFYRILLSLWKICGFLWYGIC